MRKMSSTFGQVLAVSFGLALALPFVAAADEGHRAGQGFKFGSAGKASEATRTITITMKDAMTYSPKSITVRAGQTIKFILKNKGQLLHEFNIGTPEMHANHQKEMEKMMDSGMITATGMNHKAMQHGSMKHDDPNSVLVEPGKTVELVWKFKRAANIEFACNLPGHYQSGMVGKIRIAR